MDKVKGYLIIGAIIGIFVGCMLSVFENEIIYTISIFIIIFSMSTLITYGLSQAEGKLGFFCGIALSLACVCFFLLGAVMGKVSWFPYSEVANTILWIIALPLVVGGGGTAGVKGILIIFF